MAAALLYFLIWMMPGVLVMLFTEGLLQLVLGISWLFTVIWWLEKTDGKENLIQFLIKRILESAEKSERKNPRRSIKRLPTEALDMPKQNNQKHGFQVLGQKFFIEKGWEEISKSEKALHLIIMWVGMGFLIFAFIYYFFFVPPAE